MKKIAALLAIFVLVIGSVLFWLTGNSDRLIGRAIASYGSAMTQAKVSVGTVKIAPTDGKGTIGDLMIGNPAGFKTGYAMKVHKIDVDLDVGSLTHSVILIHRIAIDAPDVIYEKGETLTNFDAIQKNIARYLGPDNGAKDDQGKKLIVEELTIRNAKTQASAAFMNGKTISVPLPDITMKNIGKAKGGISPGELGKEVANTLEARLSSAVSFSRLMKSADEALDKARDAVKGLFK